MVLGNAVMDIWGSCEPVDNVGLFVKQVNDSSARSAGLRQNIPQQAPPGYVACCDWYPHVSAYAE